MNSHLLDVLLEKVEPPQAFVIALNVMTIAGMTPANKDAISSFFKCLEYKGRIDPARTHNPDDFNVWCVFHS
jgi:hypothetical protein